QATGHITRTSRHPIPVTRGHVSIPLAALGNLTSPSTPGCHAGPYVCRSGSTPGIASPQPPPPRSDPRLRQRYSPTPTRGAVFIKTPPQQARLPAEEPDPALASWTRSLLMRISC